MKKVMDGMTQGKLAELLGEKPHRVNAVLCGNQRVPEDFLVKFIEVFKVDANWLLLGIGEPPNPELTPREAALIANYRASPEAGKRSVETTSALLAQRKGKLKDAG